MNKKAFFFIDDTIWVFRDLTRKQPASLFDNPFLKMLKKAHDEYGLKTQLNVFFKTDVVVGVFCVVVCCLFLFFLFGFY